MAASTVVPQNKTNKHEQISRALLAAFPIQQDVDILLERCTGVSQVCHKANDMLHIEKRRGKLEIHAQLAEPVGPTTHPVLIAQHMLMFASLLAQLPPQQDIGGLCEPQRVVMERFADTAISLVTTNEELSGTMESLECIMLEGLYHLNCGNIRRGWLAHRRALVTAQLIGINRPRCPPVKTIKMDTKVDPSFMWSHIVYVDRFLSLILGLPSGQPDVRLDSWDPTLTKPSSSSLSSDSLERCHARICGRILERNQLGVSQHVRELTMDIDKELRTTAESLPADFWRPPDFTNLDMDSEKAFQETMRIRNQVTHYTLLNQLHLPFMMCPSRCDVEYSLISCVYASREVLTRFSAFRAINNSWSCCRLADFLALIAGMTLIISHLDSHRYKGANNHLAHQRLGDRAMVEHALKNMQLHSKANEDVLSAKCACLLQNLLRIEAAAQRHMSQGVVAGDIGRDDAVHHDDALFIAVPYFGTIRVARDGIKSTDTVKTSSSEQHLENREADITIGGIGAVHFGDSIVTTPDSNPPLADASTESARPPQPQGNEADTTATNGVVDLPSSVFTDDFVMQQDLYPEATAGIDDWAFQGIDTAFFDSLMMGTDMQVGDSAVGNWDHSASGG